MTSHVCIHGHFYQPPREDPWGGAVPRQPGARPYHDWNQRIADECYQANVAARLLDGQGRLRGVVDNLARIGFDFGPTLLRWMDDVRPELSRAVVDADQAGGGAIAHPFNHVVLPLADAADKAREVADGVADFEGRFGRSPEGMWLPETAVDLASLEALVDHGVAFTLLAPRQIEAVAPPVGAWAQCPDEGDVPWHRPYEVALPSGRSIDVLVYNGGLSHGVAFGGLLDDGDRFAEALQDAASDDGLLIVATDGETFGHHHPHGEMALARCVERLEASDRVQLSTPTQAWRANRATWRARIREGTSWSCAHGVERWRSGCPCGDSQGADHAWRAPLRAGLDALRDRLRPDADEAQRTMLREAYTSCGWFFDDVGGIEASRNLACARRAVELSGQEVAEAAAAFGPVGPAFLSAGPSPVESARPARRAGVLLHPTSLPGPHGIGDLGLEAYELVDWLHEAQATVWQVLPLGPPDPWGSPYGASAHMAGDPMLIDMRQLVDDGLISSVPAWSGGGAAQFKGPLLREAARALDGEAAVEEFARRSPWAASAPGGPAVQWIFDRQWRRLRRHCALRGVQILGDLPIYVGGDAPEVATHPELWELDAAGRPLAVSGAPPDAFTDEGQRWGAPVYRWPAHVAEDFAWWRRRIGRALELADVVRLDHFRGFAAWWRVPAQADTAREGQWVEGPGDAFFTALRKDLGHGPLPFIAEDLGDVDEAVHALRRRHGLAAMRVLQFAWDGDPHNVHLPHNHGQDALAMTGTHDTDTTAGWWASAGEGERDRVRRHLGVDGSDIVWDMNRLALASSAQWAVVQAQDVLGLGSEARMNVPGTTEGNWSWSMAPGALTAAHAERLAGLVHAYGRGRFA